MEITIPTSVTGIGSLAFSRCATLTSVIIPSSVTNAAGAFTVCSNLTSISVDAGNVSYASLEGVLFNKDLTTLLQAPGGIVGSYTIPGSVTSIGSFAFGYCHRLTGVNIPDTLTNIPPQAFAACFSLGSFNVDTNHPVYASVDGVLFDRSLTTLITCPGGKVGDYAISNGVARVADYAFYLCMGLTNVVIPDSVTSIGNGGFYGCVGLTNIFIPNSITSMGQGAFGATGLVRVTIPSSMTYIPDNAFFGCFSLSNVVIPNSITSIGNNAFDGCGFTSVSIPDSVTTVGSYAFDFGIHLLTVTVGSGVTNIGSGALADNRYLTGVYFRGNAPGLGTDSNVFRFDSPVTVYYLPGTSGWGVAFDGQPTALWRPQVQTSGLSFGAPTNGFSFNINWASGQAVVVEACTNLASPAWTPLATNTLTAASLYFSDPGWTNYPSRLYRVRSQ